MNTVEGVFNCIVENRLNIPVWTYLSWFSGLMAIVALYSAGNYLTVAPGCGDQPGFWAS